MDVVSRTLEFVGVMVIVLGFIAGCAVALREMARGQRDGVYVMVRKYFAQSILLGLEILVAATLIRTVTIDTTLASVLALGLIVLIRALLGFSLEVEIYGRLPWKKRKRAAEGAGGEPTE